MRTGQSVTFCDNCFYDERSMKVPFVKTLNLEISVARHSLWTNNSSRTGHQAQLSPRTALARTNARFIGHARTSVHSISSCAQWSRARLWRDFNSYYARLNISENWPLTWIFCETFIRYFRCFEELVCRTRFRNSERVFTFFRSLLRLNLNVRCPFEKNHNICI